MVHQESGDAKAEIFEGFARQVPLEVPAASQAFLEQRRLLGPRHFLCRPVPRPEGSSTGLIAGRGPAAGDGMRPDSASRPGCRRTAPCQSCLLLIDLSALGGARDQRLSRDQVGNETDIGSARGKGAVWEGGVQGALLEGIGCRSESGVEGTVGVL